jgi:hypothetical protein
LRAAISSHAAKARGLPIVTHHCDAVSKNFATRSRTGQFGRTEDLELRTTVGVHHSNRAVSRQDDRSSHESGVALSQAVWVHGSAWVYVAHACPGAGADAPLDILAGELGWGGWLIKNPAGRKRNLATRETVGVGRGRVESYTLELAAAAAS